MAFITLHNAAATPGVCDYLSNQQIWTQDPSLLVDLTVKIGELFSRAAAEYFGKQPIDPLQAAVRHGDQTCMASLIAQTIEDNYPQQPNLDQQIPGIGNLLHVAIYFNEYAALETLLSEYGNFLKSFRPNANGVKEHLPLIEEKNDQGETPLMLAARLGNTRAINLLHQYNANLEERNADGQRALHCAVQGHQTASIELLNYYGVNLNARDAHGDSPIDYLDETFGKTDPLTQRVRQYDTERQHADDDAPMRINLLSHPPENIVFQGGGPKGIAYLGALNVLEENGLLGELKRVGGTSAGAIQASLLALGYQSEEMIEVFNTIDPREFLDHPLARIASRESTEEHLKQAGKELLKGVSQAYQDLPPGIKGTVQGLTQLYVLAGRAKKAIQLVHRFKSFQSNFCVKAPENRRS